MKKTFVDLTYYSFPCENSSQIIELCSSTIGYLNILYKSFTTHFVVRTEKQIEPTIINFLNIHFFQGNTLKKWQIPFRFNQHIKSLKPDFVLVHGFGSAHYLIFLKLICPNAKIILQCNGYAKRPKGLKKIAYQFSDYFIDGYLFTGTDSAKSWYENNIFQKQKVFEVMEGSNHFKFDPSSNRSKNSFLWVGGLNENKDPITILRAFNQFLVVNSSATLTMIYHQNDLLDVVKDFLKNSNNLEKAVFLQGFIEHKLLEKTYNQHQFFILGSHYEGSGYALSEAMACGCVPIVTNISSFKFMTNNGDCALLFSPENDQELHCQLVKTQQINYLDYQRKVLQQFDTKLSFDAIAKTIDNVFQSL